MKTEEAKFEYALRQGDNTLILGHRISELCGHGPALETDIALTNIALDLVGQSRNWLTYACEQEGKGRTEDDLAYLRDVYQFKNALLCELPNGHFGDTMARQFIFDAFHYHFLQAMKHSKDAQFAAIAEKSIKEVTYHLKFSSEWIIRLGDGTAESHEKIQASFDDIWMYSGELFMMDEVDAHLVSQEIVPDLQPIKAAWDITVTEIFKEAGLTIPAQTWMQSGGKTGKHSEYLGFILAELQFLPRAYPGATW